LLSRLTSLMAAAVLLAAVPVAAQQGQDASLVGAVHDQSGGVVRGASVKLSSPALVGGPQVAKTDDSGTYRASFLPPGRYDVRVERTSPRAPPQR
jgi:protocatechuate 3,4-dioxygenase beta subunit